MKNGTSRSIRANRSLPAIFAVGTSLVALPASALQLGDLTVHSRLGQPLRASIAYALAPGEQIENYCVKMRPGPSVSGLPGFGEATVSVANGVIMLTGRSPVREPMVSAHVVINCPYSANLSREYLLFIDPLTSPYEQTTVNQNVETAAEPTAQAIAVAPVSIRRPVTKTTRAPIQRDISKGTRYQVQRGESLSEIAQRIENRPLALWPSVNAIFAANPDAFSNNDPNQLKAGSWLLIPEFDNTVATTVSADPVPESMADAIDPESMADAIDAAYTNAETYDPQNVVEDAPVEVILDELVDTSVNSDELRPGDIILDAQPDAQSVATPSRDAATTIVTTGGSNARGTSLSWLAWLAGSGAALFLGLVMFGRRLREKPTSAPDAVDLQNQRRFGDTQTVETESIEALGVDYDISDDSPTDENLILDADLIIGTGLTSGSEPDISQDFGFAATTDLDHELPFEPIADATDETDMLPPLRTDEHSILDSEIFPDDDDYDMSVIVDATKIPRTEDITERDLKAVKLDLEDESMIAPNYAISKQADYQVLEQDYENEMTATQALNKEIARVAAELAERLDEESEVNVTAALPLATVTEIDITAQIPEVNAENSDKDDTGVNNEITASIVTEEETVEMPYEAKKAR